MAKQLMIYDNIKPLSSEIHRDWAVSVDDFSFASHLISAPVLATEIPLAAIEYPVVFSATAKEGEFVPLAIMGLKEGHNLFVDTKGKFAGRYLPAFIRRYPFVFGNANDSTTMTLCVDEDSKAICKDGTKGRRLFDETGEQTAYLKELVEFLKDYQYRAELTKAFCARLHELKLLEPMQANIKLSRNQEENLNLTGFYVVKREKLKALSDADLLDLFKKDGIELLYSHIQSLNNFNNLINRITEKAQAA